MRARIDAVKARLPIADVIERTVKLSGTATSRQRRGQCPFHGSTSTSLAVYAEEGQAHCYGCQWHGDVVKFVQDTFQVPFAEALARCEVEAGISHGAGIGGDAAPVQRARNPGPVRQRRGPPMIDPVAMGRWIWRQARREDGPVRRYLLGRGVPAGAVTDARLAAYRYLSECPCALWREGDDPMKGPVAPAVVADVVLPGMADGALTWRVIGVHVTYLSPDGEGTMRRRKPWAKPDDADPWLPKRRMLGPVGQGAVIIGPYRPGAHLWVGEGNETVLSGMYIGGADGDAVGVATLSLDNLQGGLAFARSKYGGERVWTLHDIRPDPERPCFTVPGHRGAVTGLIDSDMAPLRGRKDRETGQFQGELVQETRRGPYARRAISGAERARVCGELFVKGWRRVGAGPVNAMRAPPGMDFNDAARELV
ncbi:hypothetical protein AB433_07495 [Croceicoccus naphthovorans]|uniref:Zinc finger CHC2-type domain-containing protein n=1 Tax=Croceicoccus naphthovorans TaxID=1348774 RepID=A0A0G3XLY3_9SPHN|nr:hypothetical protein AB433_07495 [Croceicoccus naphthovorans]